MNEIKVKDYQRRTSNDNRDEVDLQLVFNKLGNGFNRIGRGFTSIQKLISRNAILILVFVLLSLGIGYALHLNERPFYNSTMTLMLNNIRNDFVEDQLKKLTNLVEDGNHSAIAARLEITPEAAAEIRTLRFTNLDEDRISEDSVLTGSPFSIELSLYDNTLFASMEPAIANFLETNQFFSKQRQIRELRVRKMISKLQSDIGSIDSVKTSIAEPKGPVQGFIYGEAVDPTTLFRESVNMYREQVNLESDLDRLNTIEVVNGFIPRLRPAGPKRSVYLLVSGIIGLIAGLIAASQLEKLRRGV